MGLTDENGKMYHIALSKDELEGARYAIMCGRPRACSENCGFFCRTADRLAYTENITAISAPLKEKRSLL